MVAHLPNSPQSCFLVRHEQAHDLLHIEWQPLGSAAQARQQLQHLLTALDTLCSTRWLVDLSGMPALSAPEQQWLEQHYLPQLAGAPLRHLALILTSYRQHEDLLEVTARYPPSFEVQVFDEPATALEWLRYATTSAETAPQFHAA